MGTYAFAGVQRDDQAGVVEAQAVAQEQLEDSFSLGSVPASSSLFIATSMLAAPAGSAQGTALLQVNIQSGAHAGSCNSQVFGQSSCSTQVPVADSGAAANLTIDYYVSAAVSCGPPNCGGADASVGPGYATVLALRVIDANGNPVNGATISSGSGHKYPTHFASTVTLSASPNPSTQGEPVTFTATIASFGRSGVPTGMVTFTDSTSGTTLGRVKLNAGVASLTTSSLAVGTHAITAGYSGDAWSAVSKSNISQVVN